MIIAILVQIGADLLARKLDCSGNAFWIRLGHEANLTPSFF
jgi:hypothetical protein